MVVLDHTARTQVQFIWSNIILQLYVVHNLIYFREINYTSIHVFLIGNFRKKMYMNMIIGRNIAVFDSLKIIEKWKFIRNWIFDSIYH